MAKRGDNIAVFQDTEKLCRTNPILTQAIQNSELKPYVVKESDVLPSGIHHRFSNPANVIVSKKRSLEAASSYAGQKVCVHNFASATSPGGGVTRGARAQEEAICRCSTLYFNLNTQDLMNGFYSMHNRDLLSGRMNKFYNDDCIFTPDVCVMKSDTTSPELLPENQWYSVDVITCAAPNLSCSDGLSYQIPKQELYDQHLKRMSRIMDIAAKEQEEVMILGAFGCGAFSNDPRVVARAMKTVVEKYRYEFSVIEFAVYCTAWETLNYDAFVAELG